MLDRIIKIDHVDHEKKNARRSTDWICFLYRIVNLSVCFTFVRVHIRLNFYINIIFNIIIVGVMFLKTCKSNVIEQSTYILLCKVHKMFCVISDFV
jgi:hypothetical protein